MNEKPSSDDRAPDASSQHFDLPIDDAADERFLRRQRRRRLREFTAQGELSAQGKLTGQGDEPDPFDDVFDADEDVGEDVDKSSGNSGSDDAASALPANSEWADRNAPDGHMAGGGESAAEADPPSAGWPAILLDVSSLAPIAAPVGDFDPDSSNAGSASIDAHRDAGAGSNRTDDRAPLDLSGGAGARRDETPPAERPPRAPGDSIEGASTSDLADSDPSSRWSQLLRQQQIGPFASDRIDAAPDLARSTIANAVVFEPGLSPERDEESIMSRMAREAGDYAARRVTSDVTDQAVEQARSAAEESAAEATAAVEAELAILRAELTRAGAEWRTLCRGQ